ncbi:MAG: AMP-binding protein [Solirubrobacterales bacterium]|nr:AMP-binding protein [Solirubrobacterales bacterium]
MYAIEPWLLRAAAIAPERAALHGPSGELSYAALAARARAIAGALRERGVRGGERVAIELPPGEEFAAALHACLLIGAVAVPIDLRLGAEERARRAGCAQLVLDGLLDGAPLTAPATPAPDAPATLMYTSGTTSEPRAVSLTYGNWLANALGSAVALGLDLRERWLCPMPLAHVGGLSILIRSAIYATSVVLHERFDTDAVLAALMSERERITLVSLVPTMLARLLEAGLHRPPTLRWALLGGGPIAPALLERARVAGVLVAPTYGMTEACSQIATHGWPLPGVEVRLSAEGEVLVRGAVVAPGALAADGWLHTGDLGRVDDRGRLAIIGRKADTIITGGENVAPAEVEAVLLEHPAVGDAAVHARVDPEWGEAVVASVVLRDGAHVEPQALRSFCAARLAAFKVPKAITVVERLPRTASGKLLRRQLDD